MTGRRKILICLGGIVLTGTIVAILNIKAIRHAYRQRRQEREAAYLAQHVDGYMPRDWEGTSSLVVRQIEYHGAGVVEYRWSNLGSQYRQYYGWPGTPAPEWSSPMAIN